MPGPGPKIKKVAKAVAKKAKAFVPPKKARVITNSPDEITSGYVQPPVGTKLGHGSMMTEKGFMTKRMLQYWQKKGGLDAKGKVLDKTVFFPKKKK